MVTADERGAGCKCRVCRASDDAERAFFLAYRRRPGQGQAVLHLLLHGSIPLLAAILIGWTWWALVPFLGAFAAYLFNSLYLCPSCPYHHDSEVFCGCYPKSILPLRRYPWRPWGYRENLIGRTAVVVLTLVPAVSVLAAHGRMLAASGVVTAAVVVVFLTTIVSCPHCRQRSVCVLGRLSIAGIDRKEIY